jgi:plasmid segregation protein ParM
MATKTAQPLLVAIDDGYAQTKLYGTKPDGTVVKFVMRSSVRPGRYGLGNIAGNGAVGLYDTEDGPFTVSEDVEAENTQFDGFHLSTMNRVLVNHALVTAEFGGQDVKLVTGLPVADFFLSGFKDDEKVAAKRANLLKPVNVTSGGEVARILDVTVGCQAVAAWVDYALDDDLNERAEIEGAVAIVDIGGRTTDVATVINGQSVDHQRSGTANIGVLDVYKALEVAIMARFKIRDRFPINVIDAAVRSGEVKMWGKKHDVKEIVDAVVTEHEAKIARQVERQIGSGANMSAVVFVGGGSALFDKIAEREFPHNGKTLEDPEFANARGLHKYSRYAAQG